ncbi:enhanced serine sensitivity protein SseB C-terminal domain-containing protein [Lysobacter sp. Root916]|uniref:enhanced serine sensitivity protein SseB C-terminal domain-containing protein n=1 Tax=Lysobacter sp. Root916 TaxID=1736606 RepID=UPI0012F8FD8E|nr:enhanced serine sensitivity protein SseB C-terminal domain-containing protein [Lysobacter sp. Root916]
MGRTGLPQRGVAEIDAGARAIRASVHRPATTARPLVFGTRMDAARNALEIALARAAAEPAARPAFYRLLLDSEIFAIGHTRSSNDGGDKLKLALMQWQAQDGAPYLPFFTSMEALRRESDDEVAAVSMPARNFFELTRGATVVLNPGSNCGKEFTPGEIATLLDTGMSQRVSAHTIPRSSQVLLGQPVQLPTRMLASLSALLATRPEVRAAYLCQMHDPARMPEPGLVVGFQGAGDLDRVMQDAATVVADTVPPGHSVDFVAISRGDGGLGDYFLSSVAPFYRRSWGSRLKALFSSRA